MGSWFLLVLIGAWVAVAVGLVLPAWRDYGRGGVARTTRRNDVEPRMTHPSSTEGG